MLLFDTHAHLDDSRFDADRSEVILRAKQAGLVRIVTIGIDVETSSASVDLAKQYPEILSAAVAIQPNHVHEMAEGDFERIKSLAEESVVVAIGETGLDRYWDKAPFDLQESYFNQHLDLARSRDLPVIIHCREAEADIVRVLREHFERTGPIRGILHSFTGGIEHAAAGVAMGLHVSLAGMVTFKKSDNLREIAKTIPLDRILIETDSPYLTPEPFRGRRNEPARVQHTAECLAAVFGMSMEEFAKQTTENALQLFRLQVS
jgi:TatD DNase family protein